jgi:hypothetical protein
MQFRDGPGSELPSLLVQISERHNEDIGNNYSSVQGRNNEPYTGVYMENSKLTETEEGETGEEQGQEQSHYFL